MYCKQKKYFKLVYYPTLLLALLFVHGCSKDSGSGGNNSENSKGNLSGSITPTYSAFRIVATSGGSSFISDVDGSGNYKFEGLKYGSYSLQIYPVKGYSKPSPVSVDINSSNNSTNSITLSPSSTDGNMTYTLNGNSYSFFYPFTAAYYTGIGTNGFLLDCQTDVPSADHWSLSVMFDNFNGPGTYPVTNEPNSRFDIIKYADAGATVSVWSSSYGGSATIIVNSMDTISHRISGTFNVTAKPGANASGDMTISDGTFNNLYYEK